MRACACVGARALRVRACVHVSACIYMYVCVLHVCMRADAYRGPCTMMTRTNQEVVLILDLLSRDRLVLHQARAGDGRSLSKRLNLGHP